MDISAAKEKDPRKKAVSTCPVGSSESHRQQNVGRTRTSKSTSRAVIASDTSNSQGDGHSSGSDASSDKGPSGGGRSAREKFKGLHGLLNALEEVAKHHNNVSKHNEARSIIRNTTLGEYYSRDQSTERLFAVAERVEEEESEDVLSKSFITKASGWIRMKNLLYDRLRKKCIEESGEDAPGYKCFSELFSRLPRMSPLQLPGRRNSQKSQDRDMTKAQAAAKSKASCRRRNGNGGHTAVAVPARKHSGEPCNNDTHKKARMAAPAEPEERKMGDKLQKLFADFKSLNRRQVKDMEDEEALEFYRNMKNDDLDWKTAVESADCSNITAVCERDENQIKEFSASKKKRIRWKSRSTTLTGTPAPEQRLRSTTVSTEGGAGATFVSDISSEAGLGNVAIKANTTVFDSTKLVIPLTTSTSVRFSRRNSD